MTATTEQVLESNEQIEHAIQQVAAGSNNQLISTEESALSMDKITSNIQEIADHTTTVSETSVHALEETERGKQAIEEISYQINLISKSTSDIANIIEQLNQNSAEIGQIIDIITDISEQTNLLALNAAIEAARAGEHGKGFAVVSEEIRKLADQSKASADQISTLIHSISSNTKEAVSTMAISKQEADKGSEMAMTVEHTFQSILDNIKTVTKQIQDVSSSSQEISANSEDVVNHANVQLNSMQEVSQSSEDLSKIAFDLQNMIQKFKV